MRHSDILRYIAKHMADFPNFDGQTPEQVLAELPDQDPRYEHGEAGLTDLLNEIPYQD